MMSQQIIPILSYENGAKAIQWLCDVFGFTEREKWLNSAGALTHGEIAMGDDIVMLAAPSPGYRNFAQRSEVCEPIVKAHPVPYMINTVLVYVDDIKCHFDTAKAKGATMLSIIETGNAGTSYRAGDLEGQRWMFMQKN